jgi:hypothetical protein
MMVGSESILQAHATLNEIVTHRVFRFRTKSISRWSLAQSWQNRDERREERALCYRLACDAREVNLRRPTPFWHIDRRH